MNQEVDRYLNNLDKWQEELTKLRNILANCGLTEDFKWMHPCYSCKKKNIALIHEFKDYSAILFHKGALLNDAENILVQQTENTQSARQIRFTDSKEIDRFEATIKAYIFEAIELGKAGVKVVRKKTSEFDFPSELEAIFGENPDFKTAFENLTPGRQRGYLLHFSQAKQSKTRIARIENNKKRILIGKGLNDCICGLSKRMPNCDGSHRQLELSS
jgi:uncharacterized protein YdeI (YjbR/CyaY-like superfamily)